MEFGRNSFHNHSPCSRAGNRKGYLHYKTPRESRSVRKPARNKAKGQQENLLYKQNGDDSFLAD